MGNVPEAKRRARGGVETLQSKRRGIRRRFCSCLLRRFSLVRIITTDLETRFPEDTSVRFTYLPELRALLARNQRDYEKAIDLLQPGPVDELGSPPSTFFAFLGGLYPAYLRK